MIQFKYIQIEWMGSIKKLFYRLDKPGLNIIRGENGVGKTTIFNALYWCLFGKTIKKDCTIQPWPSIIDEDYHGTKVTVNYYKDGETRVITHYDHYKKFKNQLHIEANGRYLDELRDKKDNWKWIIEDLGYSPELFKSSVLFGQKVKRIMEEDGPTRNKVLEELFEASFITKAKLKIEERLRICKPELDLLNGVMENWIGAIEIYNTQLRDNETLKEQFQKEKELNLKNLNLRLNDLCHKRMDMETSDLNTKPIKKQIHKFKAKLKPLRDLKDLKDTEFKTQLNISEAKLKVEKKGEQLKNLKYKFTHLTKRCSVCKQPIPKEEIISQKKQITKDIRFLKEDISSDNQHIQSMQYNYDKVCQELQSFNKLQNEYSNTKTKIKELQGILKRLWNFKNDLAICNSKIEGIGEQISQEEARKFKSNNTKIKASIVKAQQELKSVSIKYKALRKKVEIDEWLIKDPLSNSGLKSFVLDAMLQKTNKELVKYSSVTGFNVKMGMNLDNKMKDFYIHVYKVEEEIPHADLSGGQQQLIDLSINLAISDTILDSRGVNIQLFDEVFESLSRSNIDKVGDLLMVKAKGKSIHVITHTNFNPTNCRELHLELNSKGHTIKA